MDIVEKLKDPVVFWSTLYLGNLLMYVATIFISYLWSRLNNFETLALTKKDIQTSVLVLVVNVLVAIPGYFLFVGSYINFTSNNFLRDLLLLFFGFDLAMYILHYVSHKIWPFRQLHVKHHTHQKFNIISLYVMHPVEGLLFGALLTMAAWLFSFNFYSFITFLTINWFLGVVGHLNTNSKKQPVFFGNHIFHKTHHEKMNFNYGFYTVVWDKVFRTVYKT